MDQADVMAKYDRFASFGFGDARAEDAKRLIMQLGEHEDDVRIVKSLNDILVMPLDLAMQRSL